MKFLIGVACGAIGTGAVILNRTEPGPQFDHALAQATDTWYEVNSFSADCFESQKPELVSRKDTSIGTVFVFREIERPSNVLTVVTEKAPTVAHSAMRGSVNWNPDQVRKAEQAYAKYRAARSEFQQAFKFSFTEKQ